MVTDNKFDFKGIDTPERTKMCLRNVLTIENELRDTYTKRLQLFNKENLKNNPEPFRFLTKENCSILIFILPYEFDLSSSCKVFFLSTPLKREEKLFVLTDEELNDLDSYEKKSLFFYNKIFSKYNYDRSQIIFEIVDFHSNLGNQMSLFDENMIAERYISALYLDSQILSLIQDEVSSFQTINKTPLSYFAKDAYKFPFSLLDLKPLIELVNDDDFSYQLDQAMAAYHENLFLPCAATLGVVLETLCIKILEENKVKKIRSGDTQLGVLKDRLRQEGITSRRDHTRLEVAYKMRNMASHSSPGVALKEDCHFMLNVINTIAFEYLKND